MQRLTWDDLLIQNATPEEFRRWLLPWSSVIGGPVAPVFLNKFGSIFLRRPQGPVEMLDVFSGDLIRVADTYEEFVSKVNTPGWQETYLLSKAVYQLHEAGKVPGPGECYAIVPLPAFGGPDPLRGQTLDPEQVSVMPINVWLHLCVQSVLSGGASGT